MYSEKKFPNVYLPKNILASKLISRVTSSLDLLKSDGNSGKDFKRPAKFVKLIFVIHFIIFV